MKVLVVVDVQNDFVTGALGNPDAQAAIPAIKEKIATYLANDDIIIYTRDTHQEDYMETGEGKYLPVPHCIKGTDGWKLNDEVAAALSGKEYTEVEKITFGSVKLPELVRAAAGDEDFTVELIGLCTDICVVSNALMLKANFPEMDMFVDSACCAGVTVESHEAALTTMKMCQIGVK